MADERGAPRVVFLCRAEMTWSSGGESHKLSGMIENRSASGLGIQIATPIPIGTLMTVQFHDELHSVTVKRCVKEQFGFFVGVAFCPAQTDPKESSRA